MSKYRRFTRSDRYDKRQRNKRKVLFFSSLSILFLIVFISLLLFGNKGSTKEVVGDPVEESEENKGENESNADNDIAEDTSPEDTTIAPEDSDEENATDDVIIEEIPSDDENVITAFRGNWEPVGTKQQGPHTINYNDGSDDRMEIKQAIVMVTEIDPDDMIEHWVGRGGDQAVVATVYDSSKENIYRVYLQWVDGEGWQPTKAEKLKHL